MSTPYQYINSTGVIVPDTSDILATVQGEWQTALGADLSVDPTTDQGVMITAETTARVGVVENNAAVANQLNPNESGGIFLDAVAALFNLDRVEESFTTVPGVPVGGEAKTLIPAGSQAKTVPAGDIFATAADITLDATGNGLVTFIAVQPGVVPCDPGTLTQPVDMVFGWETVNNTGITPVLGGVEQSDTALRALRNNTLAANTISIDEAITGALLKVPGVTSIAFRNNPESFAQVIDGISLKANSVWACVLGGADADIAAALLRAKTAGGGWNGAVDVSIVEPSSGQTYTVSFDRPTAVPIQVAATVLQGTSTVTPQTAVPQAVVDAANGLISGIAALGIGSNVSPFELSSAIVSECPGLMVRALTVGLLGGVNAPVELDIALNQVATLSVGTVDVTVAAK